MAVIRKLLATLTPPPFVRKVLGGLVVAVVVATLIAVGALESWELDALDRLFLLRGPMATTAPVVIVNVDEDSLDGFDVTLYRLAAASGLKVAPLPRAHDIIINYRGAMQSFPWVPYHRVIKGDIDPKVFKDKIVLVGTTSVLLHDNFATPFERSGQ